MHVGTLIDFFFFLRTRQRNRRLLAGKRMISPYGVQGVFHLEFRGRILSKIASTENGRREKRLKDPSKSERFPSRCYFQNKPSWLFDRIFFLRGNLYSVQDFGASYVRNEMPATFERKCFLYSRILAPLRWLTIMRTFYPQRQWIYYTWYSFSRAQAYMYLFSGDSVVSLNSLPIRILPMDNDYRSAKNIIFCALIRHSP